MTDVMDRDRAQRSEGPDGAPPRAAAGRAAPTDRGQPRGEDLDGRERREAAARAEAAVAIVDQTFRAASLLGRAAFYLLLAGLSRRFDFGQHLVAGVLLGDLVAGVVIGARQWRFRTRATVAELVLFGSLMLYWWSGYTWPRQAEHEALLFLMAFPVAAGRIGVSERQAMAGWY